DIFDRLTGNGFWEKPDEVAWVTGLHCHADLALWLEPADSGSMPGSRIDDNERPLIFIGLLALRGDDPHKCVVHGLRELAAIDLKLPSKLQHMRSGLGGVLVISRASLIEHIKEECTALPGIN